MATVELAPAYRTGGNVNLVSAMQRYPFIFSNEWNYRLKRHISFWVAWWIFCSFLYAFSAYYLEVPYFVRFPYSAVEAFFFLAPHMFLTYSLLYWVIPRYLLEGKYIKTVASVLLLFLATAGVSSFVAMVILKQIRFAFTGNLYVPPIHVYQESIFSALLAGLRGGITIGGMGAAIKLMKFWYMKEQRNLQLQKENIASRLQLLKAQVHPHFLFNTLNNIYSYTQNTSPIASKLVMGLSDLLRYMLYECNLPLVPLQKELKMVQDYMVLEQIRYSHQLELNIDLPGDTKNLYIAPLLLLPFIENAFKHGTSQVIECPWISLSIFIVEDELRMKLVNGKAGSVNINGGGIGIKNVQKRLELLYPGRHSLKINNEEEVFVVNLKLELERKTVEAERKPLAEIL